MKILLFAVFAFQCAAAPDFNRIADAIKPAEGCNPHWWYGVHHKGTSPLSQAQARARCLKLLAAAYSDYQRQKPVSDFLTFLAPRYCGGDWKQWERNVKWFLVHPKRTIARQT